MLCFCKSCEFYIECLPLRSSCSWRPRGAPPKTDTARMPRLRPNRFATSHTCWQSSRVGTITRHWEERINTMINEMLKVITSAIKVKHCKLTIGPSSCLSFGWFMMWTIAGRINYKSQSFDSKSSRRRDKYNRTNLRIIARFNLLQQSFPILWQQYPQHPDRLTQVANLGIELAMVCPICS